MGLVGKEERRMQEEGTRKGQGTAWGKGCTEREAKDPKEEWVLKGEGRHAGS